MKIETISERIAQLGVAWEEFNAKNIVFKKHPAVLIDDVYEYIIYGQGKSTPTKIHTNIKEACNEAKRLASLNPNIVFYIAKVEKRFKAEINVKEV